MTLDIVVPETPTPADREAIMAPLVAFNVATHGPSGFRQVALLLRDRETGETSGGLWAKALYGWLYIELLAVPELSRGQGLGRELMRRAEERALEIGCVGLWVDCFGADNAAFYEAQGFERFGAITGQPPGGERIFLLKRFD